MENKEEKLNLIIFLKSLVAGIIFVAAVALLFAGISLLFIKFDLNDLAENWVVYLIGLVAIIYPFYWLFVKIPITLIKEAKKQQISLLKHIKNESKELRKNMKEIGIIILSLIVIIIVVGIFYFIFKSINPLWIIALILILILIFIIKIYTKK